MTPLFSPASVRSSKLLEHLNTANETMLTQFSPEDFSSLLTNAVPEYADKANVIFKAIDTDGSGNVDMQNRICFLNGVMGG